MTLAFPNPSRSFDPARKAVRFYGHDGVFEIQFFIEAAALAQRHVEWGRAGMTEARCLATFDTLRSFIEAAARNAYEAGAGDLYTLTAADFR